jgi:hypothetical protein
VHAHHLDRWKNEGVCMRLLRYMRDTFLELDTSLNDELVQGKINKSVSLHTIRVSNKDTLMCSVDQVPSSFQRESGPMHVNRKYESGSLPV